MHGEITPAGLISQDSFFENQRDSVKMIRKQLEQHEKAVIENAKRLERARLKEQEVERLKKEAESQNRRREQILHLVVTIPFIFLIYKPF
ncbi:hypothetical protein [Anaerorudis cellulosivorans]|uniref:hypothetical protein n=1 Tax=Anaerorudis cellulosivorans TaxID=3397862 RepID=UPI00221E9DB3|nr:hypothetical protein [Seramator thermalis]MCW1736241.1 hypothetical protein [Seramator thermalis]